MANIEDAKKAVTDFLKKTLNVKDVTVTKVSRAGEGWESEAEVFEASSFIKSLGLSTKVQDRNLYAVKLNGDLEVESYERNGTLSPGE
ncbi:MAG: hypothetical protein WCJ71_01965 [Candidatus Omnitrophota bacterium]